METTRYPAMPLEEVSPGDFLSPDHGLRFHFLTTGGVTTGVERIAGQEKVVFERRSDQPVIYSFHTYVREEAMIPMRDGVKLHAVIIRPQGWGKPLPMLMERTPYGVDGYSAGNIYSFHPELARSGYIFVMEDIRGRYASQGKFVMMRPIAAHHDPKSSDPEGVDESTDTWDTVDWLLKNIPENNGRVGVFGVSYPGFLAAEAGIDPHPAVKAISPQAPMTDVWIGDDFFHNGAFRQTYGYDYVLGMESTKEATFGRIDEDAYNFFLKAGSFAQAGKKSGVDKLPTGKAFIDHPSYDEFWRSRAVQDHLTAVSVPTLEVGGWWDQEDMWGTQAEYAALKPHDGQNQVFMVLGPWNHGEWESTTRHLGAVNFGAATGDQFRAKIEAPFFAKYLKDEPGFELAGVAAFETGSDRWKYYGTWPPSEAKIRRLYLGADGSLQFDAPASENAFRGYVSDPAKPVPYRERPIEATYSPNGSGWYTWLVQDQRPYGSRKDVATWTTQPLKSDLTISGDVMADLLASTSGTDSDWVVKLVDVYPDEPSEKDMAGYQLMIVDEIFQGRYRESFEKPEAIPVNKAEEYRFSLHGADHTFLKGHRIMVQVQSSWFPLYDRNPQSFVPDIMTAKKNAYRKAAQRIYAGSHIDLPVLSQK